MMRLSLKVRSLLLAIVALAVFLPITAFILEKAYTDSLTQAKMDELKLMNLSLISEFELTANGPEMPDLLYDEQLNLPESGYMGMVIFDNKIVWQSASSLAISVTAALPSPSVGETVIKQDFLLPQDATNAYFLYAYTAEFAKGNDFVPVHFVIINDTAAFKAKRRTFVDTVWKGLAGLGALLLLLLSIGNLLILAPVRTLIFEIRQASRGRQPDLNASYPVEFDGLKRSINHLLATEAEQRARYKNSLGDLAHSLKTPLAVALGSANLPLDAKEAMGQIDVLVQRQLKRATAGSKGWQAPVPVADIGRKIVNSMNIIHRDKDLSITMQIQDDAAFFGDETDLFEIVGNLLDNACKAAKGQVSLHAQVDGPMLIITVEDDGPGIAPSQQKKLLERGIRLDSYAEGQGIGMAVVSDLADIYQGQLNITQSRWSGAKVELRLPAPGDTYA